MLSCYRASSTVPVGSIKQTPDSTADSEYVVDSRQKIADSTQKREDSTASRNQDNKQHQKYDGGPKAVEFA